jgi:hypothetical protein
MYGPPHGCKRKLRSVRQVCGNVFGLLSGDLFLLAMTSSAACLSLQVGRLLRPIQSGISPTITPSWDDPGAYGWFQLYMVMSVYDEPAKSFQHILDALPNVRYATSS